SWRAFPDGHRGPEFYAFNVRAHETLQVFFDDSPTEGFDAYRHHARMHLLMMLAYPEPVWVDDDPVVQALSGKGHVAILDFGCGLAGQSRGLAAHLLRQGLTVHLT